MDRETLEKANKIERVIAELHDKLSSWDEIGLTGNSFYISFIGQSKKQVYVSDGHLRQLRNDMVKALEAEIRVMEDKLSEL